MVAIASHSTAAQVLGCYKSDRCCDVAGSPPEGHAQRSVCCVMHEVAGCTTNATKQRDMQRWRQRRQHQQWVEAAAVAVAGAAARQMQVNEGLSHTPRWILAVRIATFQRLVPREFSALLIASGATKPR